MGGVSFCWCICSLLVTLASVSLILLATEADNHLPPSLAFLLPSSRRSKRYESVILDSTHFENGSSWLALILVPSKLANFKARQFMRTAFGKFWPAKEQEKVFKAAMVFFVGESSMQQPKLQQKVLREATDRGDIVQTGNQIRIDLWAAANYVSPDPI